MANKKFQIIYVDAPWSFTTYSEKGKEKKSPETHYSCMTIEDIYSLPIKNIADENCVLFSWVTAPMLKEGLTAIEKWGFTYKTIAYTWFKRNKKKDSWFFGLGYWVRQNCEYCVLATLGNPQRVSRSVSQVIETNDPFALLDTEQIVSKIEGHSKKPDIVRDKIVELCGELPRIELFARNSYPGWKSTGYEVDGLDIRDFLKNTN